MWAGVYRGRVVSTADPQSRHRVRLQVPQVSGDALTTWAPPALEDAAIPSVGSAVWVVYQAGDGSYPLYLPPIQEAVPGDQFYVIQNWTTIDLAPGFTPDGNSNGIPQYRVLSVFGSVKLECAGGIGITYTSNAIANGGIFTNAPLPFTPSSVRSIPGACSTANSVNTAMKIDFQTSGHGRIVGTSTTVNPPWVSLNNVSYYL